MRHKHGSKQTKSCVLVHLRTGTPEPRGMEETRCGKATGVPRGDGTEVMAPLATPFADVLRATTQARKESF